MENKLLKKAFGILERLASSDGPVRFKDLKESLGLPQSTLSRALSDLVEAGYLKKSGYSRFELDVGLIYLGQRAMLNCQFPRKLNRLVASRCRATGARGALATLFKDRLVYFYNSSHEESRRAAGMPYVNHPHGSNIALAILGRLHGKEAALSILEDSMRRHEPGLPLKERLAFFSERLDEFLEKGYSLWLGEGFVNAAVPVEWQGGVCGLSLLCDGARPADAARIAKETLSLASSVKEALLN